MAKLSNPATIAFIALGTTALAQKTWDNGGGDGSWYTTATWNPDGVPTNTDDVILDNTSLAGAYTVTMPGAVTAICRTLTIGYPGNTNTIRLSITGTATVQLLIAGNGTTTDDLVIQQGGQIYNQSTAASGNVVDNLAVGNTARVKTAGTFRHNAARSFGTPFPATGNGAITFESGSTMEFAPSSPTAVALARRTYGNLILQDNSTFITRHPLGIQASGIDGAIQTSTRTYGADWSQY